MNLSPRGALWALRMVWTVVAAVGAVAVQGAADGRTGTAGTVGAVAWWLVVGAMLVTLVVPAAAGLAVARALTPLALGVAVVVRVLDAPIGVGGAMIALALIANALVMSAEAGEAFVQGSAYGQELRFPLRPPAAMLPAVGLSWLLWASAMVAATVLLAARQWVLGAVLAVAGAAATWWVFRGLVRLCRRWLVLVPAGVVLHDAVVVAETLMVQRTNLRRVRLALADTEAADLTGPCGGHALEITVRDMELAVLHVQPSHPKGGAIHVQSFLIAPSRPGRALLAMADRGLPVD